MLKVVDKKIYEEIAVQAELHGRKMKPRVEPVKVKDEKKATEHAESVYERMKKEHERRTKN